MGGMWDAWIFEDIVMPSCVQMLWKSQPYSHTKESTAVGDMLAMDESMVLSMREGNGTVFS